MKKNIREYIELSAYNRAIDHLKDRGIGATLREDKKLVVEQVDYERAVKTLDKALKWGELNIQTPVTTLKEHYDLASVIKRFPKEIKDFKEGGDLDGDLFDALYDYYFDDMPYGTKKARTGDPYEWVTQRLDQDLAEVEGEDAVDEAIVDEAKNNFVMGDTVYYNNREGRVDRQEGNKVFVHKPNGDMDVWPADETSLTRQGELPTMRKHINDIGRGLKGFFTGQPELEESQDLEEKAKNPYAVGMAQAMKSTGDEPPLKKSTIKKAHEIAKKVDAKEGYDFDQMRKDAEAHLKSSIDKQSDERIAKHKADKDKEDEPFMAQVGRKIVGGVAGAVKGGVKGAYKGFTGQNESVQVDVAEIKRLSGLK